MFSKTFLMPNFHTVEKTPTEKFWGNGESILKCTYFDKFGSNWFEEVTLMSKNLLPLTTLTTRLVWNDMINVSNFINR